VLAAYRGETINAFAEIDWVGGDKDTALWAKGKH
jgi:hypothetical protein